MISFTKAILFALYCSALSAVVVSGQRESINNSSGGAGGGSSGRGDSKAVSSSSSSSTNGSTGSSVTTSNNQNSGAGYNSGSSSKNNNSGSTGNFGTTGTLGDRVADVACPICNALPNNSYFESKSVNVGTGTWTCGYLQETVQDTNMNSIYDSERLMCRNAQRLSEEGGCCSQTMYINLPGKDPNDPCTLCATDVPADKFYTLVDTGVMGSHTCGSLDMIMGHGMLSSTMCPQIKAKTATSCCNSSPASAAVSRSAPLLRGGVGNDGVVP
jgi:hypothetical protein